MKMKSTDDTMKRRKKRVALRPSSGWTGGAKSTLSVCTIAQPASAKTPPWRTPPEAIAQWAAALARRFRDRVAYNETTYFDSLKRRGSPLASKLELTLAKAA